MPNRLVFDEPHAIFCAWKVKKGLRLTPGTVLLQYKAAGGTKRWKAHSFGLVADICDVHIKDGDQIEPGSLWIDVDECDHPVVMKDMCADCGKDLRKKDGDPGDRESETTAKVSMIHSIPELQISPDLFMLKEARVLGGSDEKHLLETRKLVLLVDLDQTILHTTNEHVNPNLPEVYHYQLYGAHSPWYHTKLRPHTKQFLENMCKYYQLHICTFGARMYAHTISKFLDQDGRLFGHRILSRDECFDNNLKTTNLKALFPCGDRLVCIIDDREDVWGYAVNVVHVKPYRYFHNTGDINAPPNMSKGSSEEDKECKEECEKSLDGPVEEHDQDYLHRLETILIRIHSTFYQLHDKGAVDANTPQPDLKYVIPYVRQKVLRNVRLVFSSIIPTNMDPKLTAIYQSAVNFGAIVQDSVVTAPSGNNEQEKSDEATTHVVAAKWGTSKVMRAAESKYKVHIVRPAWLWTCIQRWDRVPEDDYQLTHKDDGSAIIGQETRKRPLPASSKQEEQGTQQEFDVSDSVRTLQENEVEDMSAEVDDALSDEQDDDDDADDAAPDQNKEDSSSSDESLSNDLPRGWKRKSDLPNVEGLVEEGERGDKISRKEFDSSSSSEDAESIGSVDQDMIDALEKQVQNE